MKFALTIVPLLAGLASAGQILFCNTERCDGSCSFQSPAGNGACRQLGGIKSAKATQVDAGCSFTVYTDSNCSKQATTVGLNQCVFFGLGLLSYSYDC
ncbi:unnamed protein product [Parascedosporium putredinis]|uniref:Uncharacterized protein n=1 Tax=Parascedosporium putredinis TaxID=1442378 RepID=A0A9P1H9H0_9PEZI|nr:unnamed protein product [Parascedosporium putredinis]CAI8000340.1 unnamed protein product [Parascedosporium putredinis]